MASGRAKRVESPAPKARGGGGGGGERPGGQGAPDDDDPVAARAVNGAANSAAAGAGAAATAAAAASGGAGGTGAGAAAAPRGGGGLATPESPAILQYPWSGHLCAVLSGYAGARFVCLGRWTRGPEAWGAAWLLLGAASALCVGFGGGTVYKLLMHRAPRTFGWQSPVAVGAVLAGWLLALRLTRDCGRGLPVDPYAWAGWECEDTFRSLDCLNLALLILWGVATASADTVEHGALFRLAVVCGGTYTFAQGGGIARDLAAIGLGAEGVAVGNLAAAVVAPTVLASALSFALLRAPPLVQLGLGLPANLGIFYLAPAVLPPP